MDGVHISGADFAIAHPFGFCVDRDGRLCLVGASLEKRHGLSVGELVGAHVTLTDHGVSKDVLEVEVGPKRPLEVRLKHCGLVLRGCLIAIDDGCRLFLGSPVVSSLSEARERELYFGDFPPHDSTPGLLLNLQSSETSLRDARRLSADLEVALAKAEGAAEAKSRFLAVMSHEIRTPLNGFGSMVDLLRKSDLSPAQDELVDVIDDCSQVLLQLITDILDWSRNEARGVELVPAPTMLARVVSAAAGNFEAQAQSKGVEIELVFALGLPVWVRIDASRVRQVVANLVGNAVKFTSTGTVRVDVSSVEQGRLRIDVKDSGIGVPEQARAYLFEPFEQVDSSRTRQYGGSGLGLSIARQLARAMGGDVVLAETSPTGSVFRFEFTVELADDATADVAPKVEEKALPGGLRVLVAEDERTNQLIIRRLLDRLGVECDVVENGDEAVRAFESERYDVILMDMMMPVLSGSDACRRIRASENPRRGLPIVACSAAVFDADRQEAHDAGMDDFLAKPIRLEELRAVLAKQVDGTTPTSPPDPS